MFFEKKMKRHKQLLVSLKYNIHSKESNSIIAIIFGFQCSQEGFNMKYSKYEISSTLFLLNCHLLGDRSVIQYDIQFSKCKTTRLKLNDYEMNYENELICFKASILVKFQFQFQKVELISIRLSSLNIFCKMELVFILCMGSIKF